MPDTNTNLLLSLDVYRDEDSALASGWVRLASVNKASGLTATAYQKGSEIVIAFRGFDDFDPADAPDIYRAYAGLPFEQIRDAQKFVDQVLAANPGASVTLTGHSLGGALAAIMAVRNGLVAETFAGIESVGAAYKSMDGYKYDPLGVTLWKIPAATHNLDITLEALRDYQDVTNHVVFGDIATYNDRTVPLSNHIGVDSVYGTLIQYGILEDDSRFGRYRNDLGDAFTSIVPSEVIEAPYSASFATALHALGFHALQIVFNDAMNALWVSLPRLAFQLTNDRLATAADGSGSYRMTYDALDAIMLAHLDAPAAQATVAEAMVRDWQHVAAAGEQSTSLANADVNTALIQLSIQFGAAQALGETAPGSTGGVVRVFADHVQAGLDGSGFWSETLLPEGARLIRKYADHVLGAAASLGGFQIAAAAYLLSEAADGNDATIRSTTAAGDIIFGGTGNDLLAGRERGDVMFGLGGADTITGGTGFDVLAGGTGSDRLAGGSGNDVLDGGRARDVLAGGAGADIFVFSNLGNGALGDTITDFETGSDRIALVQAVFGGIGGRGQLAGDAFATGSTAADASDRIVYDDATGALWFDSDGAGVAAAIRLATLAPGLGLAASDFTII
jgi:hypothetical protein